MLAAPADTALIFFSGHGMEIEGRNYLIPTDTLLSAEDDAVTLISVSAAAASVKPHGFRIKINSK